MQDLAEQWALVPQTCGVLRTSSGSTHLVAFCGGVPLDVGRGGVADAIWWMRLHAFVVFHPRGSQR